LPIGCPRDGPLEQFDIVPDRAPPRQRLEPIVDRCVLTVLDPSDVNGIGGGNTERTLEVSVLLKELIQALTEFRMSVFVG
jgi:hypothetical protein